MQLTELGMQNARHTAAGLRRAVWQQCSSQMSRRMFFMDFYVYPAAIVVFTFPAFYRAGFIQMLVSVGLLIFGFLSWTLVEYLFHRCILHHVPFFAESHKAHHDAPRELIGTPTALSFTFLTVFVFLPLATCLGVLTSAAWFSGFLMGYFCYVAVHYVVHHKGSNGHTYLKVLKQQHARHHHGDASRNFGVTTIFWDRVFGTAARD
jgi:sterol desaturase/sphingolipid hydroxylase (fatty acid hydroxylase superfamily)